MKQLEVPTEYDKYFHEPNWEIESSTLEFSPDSSLPIIRIKNLRFFDLNSNKSNPTIWRKSVPAITVHGPVFLAPAYVPYYHAVTDVVATYEYIKKYIPETKIVFCSNQIWKESVSGMSEDLGTYMLDVLDRYAFHRVVDTHFSDILFEEVVLFPNECLWLSARPVPFQIQNDICKYSQTEIISHHQEMLWHLKQQLNIAAKTVPGKKIYVTRLSKSNRNIVERTNTQEYSNEKLARIYKDEDILEKYFSDNGFEIVDPSEMTIWEQMQKFTDAQLVVGIKGSNIFNAVWQQPGQTVVMLYTTRYWDYDFQSYFSHLKTLHVRPDSWGELDENDTDTKTPAQDLIKEYERLAELNGL